MITLPSGRKIGPGEKPFIIAEVGSNWKNLADCRHSIEIAKRVGADAVKFQLYTHEALYGLPNSYDDALIVAQMRKLGSDIGECPGKKFDKSCLNPEWLPYLKDKADKVGIEFMCTAFSPELIDMVNPFVNIHKVASAELTHLRMLEKLKAIGKPVIMSTGGHNFPDIEMALKILGATPTILLHCVAAYPTKETNLQRIEAMRKYFRLPVGFSDHSVSIDDIPESAVGPYASCVLEKHFKLRDMNTPDNDHSLNPDEFKRMVAYINGEHTNSYLGCENAMALRYNRRLIATKDIEIGEKFEEGKNFGAYRSLKPDASGLSSFLVDQFDNQSARVQIKAGEAIGPGSSLY